MLAYMDESGTPGIAISGNDWLVVALVIFRDKTSVDKLSHKIASLRRKLNLPEDHEFHRIKDKPIVREKFENLIFHNDFETCTFSIKKNRFANYATFSRIVEQMVPFLKENYKELNILADINPVLVRSINKTAKKLGVKGIKAKDTDSKKSDMLQVADYVANITSKINKNANFTPPRGFNKRTRFTFATESPA